MEKLTFCNAQLGRRGFLQSCVLLSVGGGVRRLGGRCRQAGRKARIRGNQRLGITVPLLPERVSMIKDFQQQKALRDHYDFCIIGAGPAGITLGLRLAAAGWSVMIAEGGGVNMRRTRKACTRAHPPAWNCMPRKPACVTWVVPPITGLAVVVHLLPRILPSPRQATCRAGQFPTRRSKASCRQRWRSSIWRLARIFAQ